MPLTELQSQVERLRNKLQQAIGKMPTHAAFIEQNCKAA
jgi:hypothetical protein